MSDPVTLRGASSVDERLRFAIANKRLIRVKYSGRVRIGEPHDYGIQRTPKLLIYQRRAATAADGRPIGWRLFEVSRIDAVDVLEETFKGSRRDSYEHHMHWDVVFARVD